MERLRYSQKGMTGKNSQREDWKRVVTRTLSGFYSTSFYHSHGNKFGSHHVLLHSKANERGKLSNDSLVIHNLVSSILLLIKIIKKEPMELFLKMKNKNSIHLLLGKCLREKKIFVMWNETFTPYISHQPLTVLYQS